jgi:hypothetical protein
MGSHVGRDYNRNTTASGYKQRTGYGLYSRGQGFDFRQGNAQRAVQLWSHQKLVPEEYRGIFPEGKATGA